MWVGQFRVDKVGKNVTFPLCLLFFGIFSDIYGDVQLKMFWLNSDLSWTELSTDMEIPLMGHCTVQINETFVAFIGGTPDSEDARVAQIYLYDLKSNEFTKGPL